MKTNDPEIVFSDTGPYNAVNIEEMEYLNGKKVPVRPVMLLCRCGETKKAPFCDGSHERVKFAVRKRPYRGWKRAKDYKGKEITIHFSLRVCSHAGVCFTKLPSVFDRSKRPWIDADGAATEDIIAIIRRCPSGALSYTLADGQRDDCQKRPAKIIIIDKGPLNVQGGIRIRDEAGTEPYNTEHYCLCRCGKTRNAPFCDGAHLDPEDPNYSMEE